MKNLPNNNFGLIIMLVVLSLIVIVPFSVASWVLSIFAPWWVSLPCAAAVSVVVFLKAVKFKK